MCPKDVDGIANSVDPDQTAPLGAVWSGSTLFAQTYLSENLGTIRYHAVASLILHYVRALDQVSKRGLEVSISSTVLARSKR